MPSNVIDARKRFENRMKKKSLLDDNEIEYQLPADMLIPTYPKERLTKKLADQLIAEGQLAAWADQHLGEFYEFVAEHHPEVMREWLGERDRYISQK